MASFPDRDLITYLQALANGRLQAPETQKFHMLCSALIKMAQYLAHNQARNMARLNCLEKDVEACKATLKELKAEADADDPDAAALESLEVCC